MKKYLKRLNVQQKIIIAILLPIICFIIFIPIFDNFDGWDNKWHYESNGSGIWQPDLFEPFHFQNTWIIWLIYFVIVGVLEFKLFERTEE